MQVASRCPAWTAWFIWEAPCRAEDSPCNPMASPFRVCRLLVTGQLDPLAHRLTACVRGDVSRDSRQVWAAGADDGWVSCVFCSWDTALCCILKSVLSQGAQVLWAPDPLLHGVTVSPGLFLLAFSVSSELFPSPSPSSCLKSFQFLQVFPLGGNLKKDSDLQGCCKTSVSNTGH